MLSRLVRDRKSFLNAQNSIRREIEDLIEKETQERVTRIGNIERFVQINYRKLDSKIRALENKVEMASVVEIINNEHDLLSFIDEEFRSIDDNHSKLNDSELLYRMNDFESNLHPDYDVFEFTIKDFTHSSQIYLYSDKFFSAGLFWRLKIYCKGNDHKNEHVSAFVELVSENLSRSKHQYRIEIVDDVDLVQ
jgi:hypothetical protein